MQITATTKIELNNIIYSIEFERKFRLPIEEDWRFLMMKRERRIEPWNHMRIDFYQRFCDIYRFTKLRRFCL